MLKPVLLIPLFCFISSAATANWLTRGGRPLSGTSQILVLWSEDTSTATPELTVGCLDDDGRFINHKEKDGENCGTFTVLDDYPYTISSLVGNCTFMDSTTVPNTDSKYGRDSYAWTCNSTYVATVSDALYTIPGFRYTFLCHGDINCFYDGNYPPEKGEKLPLWEYRWGYGQIGITPGHIQLQLLWNKTRDDAPANAVDEPQELLEL